MINEQFQLKTKISNGSFGDVYLALDIKTNESVAVKLEKPNTKTTIDTEKYFLEHLSGTPQIPNLYWSGKHYQTKCIVFQYLGKDLSSLLKEMNKFSLQNIFNIGIQMISILQSIHDQAVIHRDIKPENILLGTNGEKNRVYLVDFGISTFYRDNNGHHKPFRNNQSFIGTKRYAPIAAHLGYSQGRKDDLESLGYMLIYLLKQVLPWSFLTQDDANKTKTIGKLKMETSLNDLCQDLPKEFLEQVIEVYEVFRYMKYVRGLEYEENPNYEHLKLLFQRLTRKSFQSDDFSEEEERRRCSTIQKICQESVKTLIKSQKRLEGEETNGRNRLFSLMEKRKEQQNTKKQNFLKQISIKSFKNENSDENEVPTLSDIDFDFDLAERYERLKERQVNPQVGY